MQTIATYWATRFLLLITIGHVLIRSHYFLFVRLIVLFMLMRNSFLSSFFVCFAKSHAATNDFEVCLTPILLTSVASERQYWKWSDFLSPENEWNSFSMRRWNIFVRSNKRGSYSLFKLFDYVTGNADILLLPIAYHHCIWIYSVLRNRTMHTHFE